MPDDRSRLEETLSAAETHDRWERTYRTAANERLSEIMFDDIAREFRAINAHMVLDAGCGTGAYAVKLARRGFNVHAVDLVPSTIDIARSSVARHQLNDRVTVSQEDLTSLSFPDASFRAVLCWGVLMHIPDITLAIHELARVLEPGGRLVVGENNVLSPEALLRRSFRKLRGRGRSARRAAGEEYWKPTEAGPLLVRQADIGWLTRAFAQDGLLLRTRRSGGFSEAYSLLPGAVGTAIHALNRVWYRRRGDPRLAFGNILIFERRH